MYKDKYLKYNVNDTRNIYKDKYLKYKKKYLKLKSQIGGSDISQVSLKEEEELEKKIKEIRNDLEFKPYDERKESFSGKLTIDPITDYKNSKWKFSNRDREEYLLKRADGNRFYIIQHGRRYEIKVNAKTGEYQKSNIPMKESYDDLYYYDNTRFLTNKKFNSNFFELIKDKHLVFIDLEFVSIINKKEANKNILKFFKRLKIPDTMIEKIKNDDIYDDIYKDIKNKYENDNISVPFKYGIYIIPKGTLQDKDKHMKYEGYIKSDYVSNENLIKINEDLIKDNMKDWLKSKDKGNFGKLFDSGTPRIFKVPSKNVEKVFSDQKDKYLVPKTLKEIRDILNIYEDDRIFIGQNIEVDLLGYQKPKKLSTDYFMTENIFSEEKLQDLSIIDFTDFGGYIKSKINHLEQSDLDLDKYKEKIKKTRKNYGSYGPIKLSELWTEIVGKTTLNFVETIKRNPLKLAHNSPLVDCALSAEIIMKAAENKSLFLFQNTRDSKYLKKLNCRKNEGILKCKLKSEVISCNNNNKDNKYKYEVFNCGNSKVDTELTDFKTCVQTNNYDEGNIKYCDIPNDLKLQPESVPEPVPEPVIRPSSDDDGDFIWVDTELSVEMQKRPEKLYENMGLDPLLMTMMAVARKRFLILEMIIMKYITLKNNGSINYNLNVIFPKKQKYTFINLLQLPQPQKKTKALIGLGTGLAIGQWTELRKEDEENLTKENHALTFASYITDLYEELQKKYPIIVKNTIIGDLKYDSTAKSCVTKGLLNNWLNDGPGYSKNDNTFNIHIWGANNTNFNYKSNTPGHYFGKNWGGGQAECFITQHSGVFGFVSTPFGNSVSELEKLLKETDKIWGTSEKTRNNFLYPKDKKTLALETIGNNNNNDNLEELVNVAN